MNSKVNSYADPAAYDKENARYNGEFEKFNKTSEFVSNIENPESLQEVRDFLALCPFAIFKLKVGVY